MLMTQFEWYIGLIDDIINSHRLLRILEHTSLSILHPSDYVENFQIAASNNHLGNQSEIAQNASELRKYAISFTFFVLCFCTCFSHSIGFFAVIAIGHPNSEE